MNNTYLIKTFMYKNESNAFVEHLNYSGIEYQRVNESKEPVNFETACYELDDMNFNLLQLTLPDNIILNKSSNYYYIMPN
jgi:hypothetical protein